MTFSECHFEIEIQFVKICENEVTNMKKYTIELERVHTTVQRPYFGEFCAMLRWKFLKYGYIPANFRLA